MNELGGRLFKKCSNKLASSFQTFSETTMNLHSLDLPPDLELQTSRLRVCAAREDDGSEVNAAVCASWHDLRLWMPWAKTLPSLAESQMSARGAAWKWQHRNELDFTIRLRSSGQVVGKCGLHTIEPNIERAEIGYWLDSRFTGYGLMSEAVARVVIFGDEVGFQRLEIRCDDRNTRSQNVARRAGFEREGCLRRFAFDNQGKWSDLQIWARLRDTRG